MKNMYISTKTETLLNHGPTSEWAEVLALLLFLLLSSSDSKLLLLCCSSCGTFTEVDKLVGCFIVACGLMALSKTASLMSSTFCQHEYCPTFSMLDHHDTSIHVTCMHACMCMISMCKEIGKLPKICHLHIEYITTC